MQTSPGCRPPEYRPPSPRGQTNTCENITLPQTVFAGGKYERINYRPQTKLRKGNVFESVCQGFCLWGCIPACTGADTLPSWADTPGQTLPGQTPALGRHPRADTLPGQTPSLGRHPPWADTLPGQTPSLGRHPPAQCILRYTPLPSACWDTPPLHRQPLQQTVRILLECILVKYERRFMSSKVRKKLSQFFLLQTLGTRIRGLPESN